MAPALDPPFPLAGELASLGAALIWSVSTSIYARFGRALSAASLNLLKNAVAIVCLGALGLALSVEVPADPSLYAWLAASGVIGLALGDTALFAALKRLGAQVTSSLQCLTPPISAMVAALFLGETMTIREVCGMLLTAGAVGGIVYFSGREQRQSPGVPGGRVVSGIVFAVLAAACQGTQIVISRHALQQVHVVTGTAMRIAPAILLLILMRQVKSKAERAAPRVPMGAREAGFLLVAAFLGTFVGLILMSVGAKYTKAGIAAALTSTYPIWILPISRFVLKEKISWQRVTCTLLAVSGIIILVTRSA